MDPFVLSVFELNTYVSDKLYQDAFLNEIWVQGEVGNVSVRHETVFFILTDGQATVECILFDYFDSEYADLLNDGDEVMIKGNISLYRKNGSFRIVAEQIEAAGLGRIYAELEQLKKKLEQKGVFKEEFKQNIPLYPSSIGIVTSSEGAAIHDITHVVKRRNPSVQLVLYPVKVQGAAAPFEIANGIRYFNEISTVDVLIVGRGGGAAEDLFAFNDENVVMEIFHSNIPVISAVGHESDFTLSDLAADLRAPTPSAAAELAVTEKSNILSDVRALQKNMKQNVRYLFDQQKFSLEHEHKRVSRSSLQMKINAMKQQKNQFMQDIEYLTRGLYHEYQSAFHVQQARLENLNPETLFKRGYTMTQKGRKLVKSITSLKVGDQVDILFTDGQAKAEIKELR